jgi:hypothetical protein
MLSSFSNTFYITLSAQEEPAVAQLASPLDYFIFFEFFFHGGNLGITKRKQTVRKGRALHMAHISTFLCYHSSGQKRSEMQACHDERKSENGRSVLVSTGHLSKQ